MHWKTGLAGLARLHRASRIEPQGDRLRYVRFARDFDVVPISDRWESVQAGKANLYAVQTAEKAIERCLLMTTKPGDLVLDPTCGSGTTAVCRRAMGPALDHDRYQPGGPRHCPTALIDSQVRLLRTQGRSENVAAASNTRPFRTSRSRASHRIPISTRSSPSTSRSSTKRYPHAMTRSPRCRPT